MVRFRSPWASDKPRAASRDEACARWPSHEPQHAQKPARHSFEAAIGYPRGFDSRFQCLFCDPDQILQLFDLVVSRLHLDATLILDLRPDSAQPRRARVRASSNRRHALPPIKMLHS